MTVFEVENTLTKDEVLGWLSYFKNKPADIQEIQMAMLITSVRNALGGKTKVDEFILTSKKQKQQQKAKEDEDTITIGDFQPIAKKDLNKFFRPM